VDNTEKSQAVLSFCSGYGGIELGLELAGVNVRPVAYVEIEAFAIANLVAKMEQGLLVPTPVWTNLKIFPLEKFRGKVDGITGGYPCQPFSHAGKRKGGGDPRHLWPFMREAVVVLRPRWVFFENVEGHISLGLSTVISDLEEIGYKTTWGIFSAQEVGAPHQRKRVFILGYSECVSKVGKKPEYGERGRALLSGQGKPAELANNNNNNRCLYGQNDEQPTERREYAQCDATSGGTKELGNTSRSDEQGQGQRKAQTRGDGAGPKELADGEQSGLEGYSGDEQRSARQEVRESGSATESRIPLWPARPGEEQHGWEEPRVVADTKQPQRRSKGGRDCPTGDERREGTQRDAQDSVSAGGEAESSVGRAINGITSRVDELRLLGNGVVPQTACKAWITLNNQLKEESCQTK
jgi:DNA (cytosine-5)-methyltransferase 1